MSRLNKSSVALAVATALSAATMGAAYGTGLPGKSPGNYVTGDFHNHTTCSDGSISMQKLVKKSTDKQDTPWGLDWFVQAGHGGSGNRNCTLAEDATLATPAYPLVSKQDGTLLGPTTDVDEQQSGRAAEGHAVERQLRGRQYRTVPEHVALAVDPGIPVPAARVPLGAQEQAAVHRRRIRRRRPRAHLDVGHHRPDAVFDLHAETADRPGLHAARQRDRDEPSGSTASIATTPTRAAATRSSAESRATTGIARSRAA